MISRIFTVDRPRARGAVALAIGVAATVLLGRFLDGVYPVRSWLIWRLLTLWAWECFFTATCAAFGHFVLTRVLKVRDLPDLETIALSMPVGLVCFVMGMYAGGFLSLYGPLFAIALPSVMLLVGAPSAIPPLRARLTLPRRGLDGATLTATLFGTLCLALMYLELMTPDALNYDSTWYHLVVAEAYAREGKIVPFLANWNNNLPHLTPLLNTWAFTVPGLNPPLRWMMALHTEFTVFLWTLLGVGALVRWLCDERRVRGAWVAYFLFPSIFVYDSNLAGSADHIVALFAPALLLASVRLTPTFAVGRACALGMIAAGAILTKYQAVYLLVAIGGLLVAHLAWLGVSGLRRPEPLGRWRQRWLGLGVLAVTGAALASPHFIENWVRYRNPVYPLEQSVFKGSTPSIPGAADIVEILFKDYRWHPPGDIASRIRTAGEMLFTFSFKPHYSFVRNLPCFGFLFTLVLPFLFVIPNSRRLWVGYFVAAMAVFTWACTYWVDRNLQIFLPLLVAATAAIIVRVWDLGWIARLGLIPLVGLQIAWGGDFMFTGSNRLESAVDLIRSGIDGRAEQRFSVYRAEYSALGNAMPKGAVALLHNHHVSLGIDRTTYLDWIGFQGLIDYRSFRTPREAYDRFAAIGVTHIIYAPGSRTAPSKQEEIIFDALAAIYAKPKGRFGSFELLEMPGAPPPEQRPFHVLTLSVGQYQNGIYPIEALGTCEEMPPERQVYVRPEVAIEGTSLSATILAEVDAALVSTSFALDNAARTVLDGQFRQVSRYDAFAVYVRTPPQGSRD